tara:strand:+ start:209 stop:403 length:195 start_codon:yes stop_codon:yes gene_type:complete
MKEKAIEYLNDHCQVGRNRAIIYDGDGFVMDLHSSPIEGMGNEEWGVVRDEWAWKTTNINRRYK